MLYPPLPDIEDMLKSIPEEQRPHALEYQKTSRLNSDVCATAASLYGLDWGNASAPNVTERLPHSVLHIRNLMRRWLHGMRDAFLVSGNAQALAWLAAEPVPDLLKERIRRQSSACAKDNLPPLPGQVRRLIEWGNGMLPRPLCFLLDQPDGHGGWLAWMVATEVDYATDCDLLIEEAIDGPVDPLAGMVQAWNRSRIAEVVGEVIGELSPERVDLIRQLAALPPSGESARPGHIHLRAIGNHSILCGTPLGGKDDPRRHYQDIYRRLARWLSIPAD
ncbi:hypothetical protein MASR1M60_05340 [Rhodocyclaceae bacterium]